jgi:hypothetical protein
MASVPTSRPGPVGRTSDHRALRAGPVRHPPTAWTSRRWGDEQAQLACDLAALMRAGLIVAVDDGPDIRCAPVGGKAVLP